MLSSVCSNNPEAKPNCLWLNHGDAVDFDIERPGPFRDVDEDAGGRILREVMPVDRVDSREVFGGCKIDVALHYVLQRGARRLQAQFHLFEDQFGLALNRNRQISPVAGSNGGKPETK